MAADRGSMVSAADDVEANKIMLIRKAGLQSHFLLEIAAILICTDMFLHKYFIFPHLTIKERWQRAIFGFLKNYGYSTF